MIEHNSHTLDALIFSSIQQLPTIVLMGDDEGNIIYMNGYALRFFGYDETESTSLKIWDVDVGITSPENLKIKWKTTGSGNHETLYRKKNGDLVPIEISCSSIDHNDAQFALVIARDISERKANLEEINLFHSLIDQSHDMVFILRLDNGYIEYANKTTENILGYSLDEMRSIGVEGFRRPLKEDELFLTHLQELKEKKRLTDYAMLECKDGTELPIEVNASVVHYHGTDYNIAIVRDITERAQFESKLTELNKHLEMMVKVRTRELEQHIARLGSYKDAMDANSIVSISDIDGNIIYVNDNFCKVSGYSAEEVMGKPHSILRHPDSDDSIFQDMWYTITAKQIWKGVLKNRKKNGDTYIVDIAIIPILDEKGDIVEYIAIRHEITQLVERKEELKRQAYIDKMTGFGSRLRLIEDVKEMSHPSLCYIDIDKFNNVNDFYGLEFGDRFLQEFARTLLKEFGTEIHYYRLHGDQYALLSEHVQGSHFESKIGAFVEMFNRQSFVFEDKEITLRITASLSMEEGAKLISSCDLAMRFAKKHNKAFVVYSSEMGLEEEVRANMDCAVKLQHAIVEDRITVFCQPLATTGSLEITKYECLIRLIDEDGTVISPFQFLAASKQSKQYGELSKIVITKAFDLVERYSDKSFSINITIDDILNEEIVSLILGKLAAKRSLMPVIFELVESEGIENFNQVLRFIRQIKSYGSLLAIDDFGTGYSNFEYLLKLDADFIKIDGSLIRNIETDINIQEIVKLITEFAKRQNIKTVAEFVASEGILEWVTEIGIDFVQGYHIGKPEPLAV